jgi:hypothetical protein
MVVGPKANRYPVILHFDENGNPKRLAESNVIAVDGITASSINTLTISATSYLGAPIGGVTAIGQLADVDPQITDVTGNVLIVGAGNAISGLASSTFATNSNLVSLSNTVTILQGASGGATGSYVPLSGGTMTGALVNNVSLSTLSITATTYNNLPSAIPGEYGVVNPDGDPTHYLDGDGNWTVPPGGTGVSSFSALVDTFANYPTRLGNVLVVHQSGSGINSIASTVFAASNDLTSLSTTVTNHLASAVHWTRAQLNTDYVNTSGDTMTGTLNGISALFTDISATNYYNVTATVGSATTTAIGGLQLNGLINTFYNGSGQWVSGVEASSVLYLSGGVLTGGLSGPNISATNYYGLSAAIKQVSATTYVNLPTATSSVTGIALLANDNQSLAGAALRSTDTRLTWALQSTKGISIISAVANDNFTVFYTGTGTYSITEIATILQGGESISATITFYTSSVRNAAGTTVTSLALTSVTTAELATNIGFGGDTIASGTFLWVKVNSVSVTPPSEINATIYLTRTG